MGQLLNVFKSENEDVRFVAMQSLVELGTKEYEYMHFYLQKIWDITNYFALNDEERIGA